MPTLSVILITNNEANNIRRALDSVKFADEIIINDSGSTDGTIEIAQSYGCSIIQSEFVGFGIAKQTALNAAKSDWVLSIDADEEIDQPLATAIVQAIKNADYSGYHLNRKSQFLGRWILHSGWYPDYLPRLFRRDRGRFTSDSVHEQIQIDGDLGKLEGHILHYTDPDIEHYLQKLNRYTTLSADGLQRQGRRFKTLDILIKPPATFIKMYLLKGGFRDGIQGLMLALLSSFHVLCKYAKLWERQRR
ncbi:MAG: glycosyltransferase family 2 protein [Candidatus Zixiibacteriota bacterium]|nr:MAG: glycosyltransferase family 2 protein [candidate division Zixibacteria bacterium]